MSDEQPESMHEDAAALGDAPVPLRDQDTTGSSLRSDLAAAADRGALDDAVSYDMEAGLAQLTAAIQVAGAAGGGAAGGGAGAIATKSAVAKTAAAAGMKATWWGLAAAGLAGVSIATFVASSASETGPNEPTHAVTSETEPEVHGAPEIAAESNLEPAAEPDLEPDLEPAAEPDLEPAAKPKTDMLAPVRKGPEATPAPDASAALGAEMAHLTALRAAASTDPSRAVRLADEGHAQFPRGVFGQEREAIAIRALAASGRQGEARTRAEAFLQQHPDSPLADSVRRAAP